MCGIAGFCDFSRDNRTAEWGEVAWRMGETLARRGPDDDGVWQTRQCALAHRRLAVIDPAHGAQPMVRTLEGGQCAICYNGELYNTPELRRELEALGVALETWSDTEVLLWQCILFGEAALEKLEGIFAFAFWDGRSRKLLLARDRCGVKPLFYARRGSALVFGSEPKALFAYPGLEPRADQETWQEVLGINPARTPGHGVFAGVHELKPGHWMRLGEGGTELRRWWNVVSRVHTESYADTVEHLRYLLSGAIRRQLVSDVPLATLLSGGLDSSVITAVAARAYEEQGYAPLETYSFDYTDNDKYFHASSFQPDADWPWVERMSQAFQTRHTVLTCDIPSLVQLLDQAVEAKDLPGMADVDSSLLYFCRQVARRHVVAVSGECSDEIFGGYPWFHRADMLAADTFPWCKDLSPRTDVFSKELCRRIGLEEYVQDRYHRSVASTPRLEGERPEEARRREIAWLNIHWFMATLLDRKDRMSMAAGLEVRVPFCDHHLVEYVWNIPWAMKAMNGQRKQVLRDAVEGLLPEELLRRPKNPYPKTHDPLYEQLVRARLLTILDDRDAPIHSLVDEKALRAGLLSDAGDYGKPWFGQLMAGPQMLAYLIQINEWMSRYHLTV